MAQDETIVQNISPSVFRLFKSSMYVKLQADTMNMNITNIVFSMWLYLINSAHVPIQRSCVNLQLKS